MKVISSEELANHGISKAEIQQALEIQCFTKKFRRKSDLPKKFKDKAINVCAEIAQAGLDTFITETNYSYTIWEESKNPIKLESNNVSANFYVELKNQPNLSRSSKVDNTNYSQLSHLDETVNFDSNNYTETAPIQVLDGNFNQDYQLEGESTFNHGSTNYQIRTQNEIEALEKDKVITLTEPVKKYRGLVVTPDMEAEETKKVYRKKQRTYRGIIY